MTNAPHAAADSLLVRAAFGRPGPRPPVWFMRQAGRSLPEYRQVRAGTSMLEACRTPDLITELTLQPVRRHGVDAAILFSDIVVPLAAVGVGVDIVSGVGPVVDKPIRTMSDLDRLRPLEPSEVPYLSEAVSALVERVGRNAAHRLCRSPVHARQLLGRGWSVSGSRPYQGADARRADAVALAVGPAGNHLRDLSQGAGRCGCRRRAAVRLVGRGVVGR